jgi:superfamily II DNA or RNA helicase
MPTGSLLPKLKERGHRVLLFSQFVIALNVIERFLQGERIKYVRLDGNTPQSERQENIDRFNAPDSDISVFILSTRAGGVGINLATADTVIIHDADFNPFQDLQAISRAHRIGQKKKVMCFKLMVKDSCEEKIVEKGKKKMVLEQLIIDSSSNSKGAEEEDATVNNVESLLLFGAKALFDEKEGAAVANEITYSSKALDELIENTEKSEESAEAVAEKKQKSIEANKAFSYARVWERSQAAQEEEAEAGAVEAQRGFW